MADHPFPQLNFHPMSGLRFRWSESLGPGVETVWSASFGPDGSGEGMVIYIHWEDLEQALTELLGYSYRVYHGNEIPPGKSVLKRVLPWQSPQWNQLYVQRVSQVKGLSFAGKTETENIGGGGQGMGGRPNLGPWSNYDFAAITVQFHRPHYYILTDDAIRVNGVQREWLRYTDKHWQPDIQILSREGSCFVFAASQGTPPSASPFPGTVGQKIMRYGLKRKWYQIPEAGVFELELSVQPNAQLLAQPNGVPTNLSYTQTATTNPITGITYLAASPIGGCVNSPIGGGITDTASLRFFGFPMGTLLYKSVSILPRDLQLPPALMQIPSVAGNVALSQVQYDVEFGFDFFDPVRDTTIRNSATTLPVPPNGSGALVSQAYRGHNLMPWAGNGRWYAVNSLAKVDGSLLFATPFDYADFSDLFQIL